MNIYVLNTLAIGEDTMEILSHELTLKGIIGLSKRGKSDAISDYSYQGNFAKQVNLDFIEVDSYALSNDVDKNKLLDLEIDVLIVSGWQRLIPDWLIQHCSICAIGTHGSPLGITKGRGRSPQNWALLMGLDSFEISIFQIDAGIDSGRILATKKFKYSPFDDIKSSYYKTCLLTSHMIIDLLKTPNFIEQDFKEQSHDKAEFFPQRTAEDGYIDWNRSGHEIRNFVRALTNPYPGAVTFFNGHKIKIWDAIPFEIDISAEKYTPGEIVKIFNKLDILVRTKDSFLLINDYDLESEGVQLKRGNILSSASFKDQMKTIIERHEERYQNMPISVVIKTFA